MKKIIAVLFAVTMSWSITAVVVAETNEQAAKEKNVAKSVKKQSANEKMMPAPEEQLKRLTKGMMLSVEQQNKIRPMLMDEFAKLKEFRNDENLSPKQIQVKVEALRSETVAKMKTVLTPDQIERLDLVSKEIKENKQKRIKENRKALIGTQVDSTTQQPKQ